MSGQSEQISILHVDDEPDFAEMVAEFLARENDRFSVETANGADEVLDNIKQQSVDCIVSDYDMPGRNGIELLEEVRKLVPELPFILFTGKGSEEIASEAISAGVTDYLQKGGGSDQYVILANRIQNAVDKTQAERRATEAQGLYQSLTEDALDTSEVGTFILDSNFEIVWINSAIETYFDIERDEVIGEDKRELIDSDIASIFDSPDDFAQTVTATYDDNSYVEEFECHVLGGENREERWLRHWSQPIETGRFAGGRIEHYTDITEFKEREQEIASLNELHETVLANIRDTVLLTDDEGRFTYICPNVEFIFGIDREEVANIGTIEEFLGERLVAPEELAERGEIHNLQTTVENEAGESRKLLVTVSSVEIEEGSQLYSIRDVTDLSNREQRLEQHNERLERLHQAADALHQAATREEIAELVVEAAEDILDFPLAAVRYYREEAGGLVPVVTSNKTKEILGELDIFGPEDGSLNWNAYESGTTQMYGNLSDIEHAIDSDSPIESLMHFPMGEHGTISVSDTRPHSFDETDRFHGELLAKTAEQALSKLDREEKLLRQRDELNRRNERLEEFASVVSHDLRNPLDVIEGRVELAREESDSEHLDAIARAADRMDELIEDLLTLAREGDEVGEMEPVELDSVAVSCWQNVETDGASLTVETNGSFVADRSQLRQLLENLFRNSVEHGGPDVAITVGMSEEADGFYVEDDGGGISAADRDRVFEAGYSTVHEGTGFGLTIVRGIAENHDWDVHLVEGRYGGARFEFRGVKPAD